MAEYGYMRELEALLERGFMFHPVTTDDGEILVLVGPYGWHGYFDRIHIWSESEAVAARERSDHRPFSGNVVWEHEGTAAEASQALLELPKPGDPSAPTIARSAKDSLWRPLLSPKRRHAG